MDNTVCQIICDLVHIAPAPRFAGFNGPDNWVMRAVEVLRGVLILGGITAADMAAGQADS